MTDIAYEFTIGSEEWYAAVRDLRNKYLGDKAALGACTGVNCIHPARDGYLTCENCSGRNAVNYQRYLDRGVCTQGGCDDPPAPGRKKCQKHLDEHRVHVRRSRVVRKKLMKAGYCRFNGCVRKAAPGRKACDQHLKIAAAAQRKKRAEQKAQEQT